MELRPALGSLRESDGMTFLPNGQLKEVLQFIKDHQLYDTSLFAKFVSLFRTPSDDADLGWRCEYWGKMMCGGAMICKYDNDDRLYATLEASVKDLLRTQKEDGSFTTYSPLKQFQGWDVWGRKYILLGLEYFYEICRDPDLSKAILRAMMRHADAILAEVGENKLSIHDTSMHWQGINSCSILEPYVRLYNLTKEKRYLDFAAYIVNDCKTSDADIFACAFQNKVPPSSYPVTKAYEVMSCFEGLTEYYRVTRNPEDREAVIRFADAILANETTILGSIGCTGENFDHARVTQTKVPPCEIMQETCVSVTWMKLCFQLLCLTGNPKYADAMERTFYNAYLGTLNTELNLCTEPVSHQLVGFLPFDSYTPLLPGSRRGFGGIGGFKRMSDGSAYGCCACIGSVGMGIFPAAAILRQERTLVLNHYFNGTMTLTTPGGQTLRLQIQCAYPYDDRIRIVLHLPSPESFVLALRIAKDWKQAEIRYQTESFIASESGYVCLDKQFSDGDAVILNLDLPVRAVYPDADAENRNAYFAVLQGNIVYALDSRCGVSSDVPLAIRTETDQTIAATRSNHPALIRCNSVIAIPLTDGNNLPLVDFASAGKHWKDSYAVWMNKKS